MTTTAWPFVELDQHGIAYVHGTTTKVIEIAVDHTARDLLTAEEIRSVYPSLSLPQIHAALGYYYDHREQCDRQIEERRQRSDQLLARLENPALQERLQTSESRGMSLALYMDHHVDCRISQGLRTRGYDTLTAFEDGYDRRPDDEILARATELGRIVFTHDEDFLEIAADWQMTGRRFSGLVYWRTPNLSVGVAIRDLELIVQAVSPTEIENTVVWIPL